MDRCSTSTSPAPAPHRHRLLHLLRRRSRSPRPQRSRRLPASDTSRVWPSGLRRAARRPDPARPCGLDRQRHCQRGPTATPPRRATARTSTISAASLISWYTGAGWSGADNAGMVGVNNVNAENAIDVATAPLKCSDVRCRVRFVIDPSLCLILLGRSFSASARHRVSTDA
jgi:hypothetical protein